MAEKNEAISIVATDGEMFYGLRLAVTPAVKARVASRDVTDPLFEGTGTQVKFRQDMTAMSVAAKVQTYIRYASVSNIDASFVRDLIYNMRHKEVYNFFVETGVRAWEGLEYLSVPVPEESPRGITAPEASNSTQKVNPRLLLNPFDERSGGRQINRIGLRGAAHWAPRKGTVGPECLKSLC